MEAFIISPTLKKSVRIKNRGKNVISLSSVAFTQRVMVILCQLIIAAWFHIALQ